MSLTAIDPDLGILDATQSDLGCGRDWAAVHRVRPRPVLLCPACHHRVHAKLSPGGVRFFAHDPGASRRCALAGESVAHHRLKLALASAVRSAGHHASVEAADPGRKWRADVLSVSPDRAKRWAWEAQLSAATSADIEERTARYAADGIRVCWASDRSRNWLGTAPSLLVRPADVGDYAVEAGPARFVTEECTCSHGHRTCPAGRHGHWGQAREAPLGGVVVRILNATLLPYAPAGPVGVGSTGVWRWLWATSEAIAQAEAHAEDERVGRERWRTQRIEYTARRFPEANASFVSAWQQTLAPVARQRLQDTALAQARVESGKPAFVHLAATAYHFGCGVLVTVGSAVPTSPRGWYGLIRPDPARLDMKLVEQLGLVLFTTSDEAAALSRAAPPGTRVVAVETQGEPSR